MKQQTVSIGIAAYNEQNNIAVILKSLLSQKQDGWKLKEIRVYSDGSSDETVARAKSVKNKKIAVIEDKQRKGKTKRIRQILKDSTGDIIVLFDADIMLEGPHVISRLIKPFVQNQQVMVTGGNTRPFTPKTFFEKSVYTTFLVFDESRRAMKNGDNVFGCNGGCMAVRKKFVPYVRFRNVLNDDDLLYFSCIYHGYTFKHVNDAIVYYSLPSNLKDYLKQNFRSNPEAVQINLEKYFGPLVKEEYYRPKSFYTKAISRAFGTNPLGTAYMIMINILCKPFFPIVSKHFKLNWFTAESTK